MRPSVHVRNFGSVESLTRRLDAAKAKLHALLLTFPDELWANLTAVQRAAWKRLEKKMQLLQSKLNAAKHARDQGQLF